MTRRIKVALAVYGIWVVGWLCAAGIFGSEFRIATHLLLALTGMPSSLLSLYLPHSSLLAIAVAGSLGLLQWVALAALDYWLEHRQHPRSGS